MGVEAWCIFHFPFSIFHLTIIGVVSVFGLVFLWLLALCAEKGVHPLGRVRQGFRRLPGREKTLILIFVSVWIAFAGTKDGTNGVDQVEGETNTVTQVEGGTNVLGGAVQGRARSPNAPQCLTIGFPVYRPLRRARRARPGTIQVMYDGTEEILFLVDCGARYAFSVSCGEIARINTNMTSLSVLG